MKTLELTEENINAISHAIIVMIRHNCDSKRNGGYFIAEEDRRKYCELLDEANAKWQTLLNYINS